jgi:hypothetical protein
MSRGFTYGGGQRREKRWVAFVMTCTYCDNTVRLRYETDNVNRSEGAQDLYRALRSHGWLAFIEHPGPTVVKPICPICKAADHD